MSAAEDDYDKLSKEEREARDKADREREAAEQAGTYIFSIATGAYLVSLNDHFRLIC